MEQFSTPYLSLFAVRALVFASNAGAGGSSGTYGVYAFKSSGFITSFLKKSQPLAPFAFISYFLIENLHSLRLCLGFFEK